MSERRTLVSVDLDPIGCYHAIHGLPSPASEHAGVVLARALPRFLDLFDELGVRATFFVVGADAEAALDAGAAEPLARAVAGGHELGNHSHAHPYDLVRRPAAEVEADLARCDAVLRRLGAAPQGFRAPGYTHDAEMLACVARLGYRYDSSSLPSPSYFAAKLAAIAWHALHGRTSQSLARAPGPLFGARGPHRVRAGDGELWELPISVLGALRLPLVGTFALAGPGFVRGPLVRAALRADDVHLELHGLDLADADEDPIDPRLHRLQPELRTPLADRRARLADFLRARGRVARLCDAI
jgi:hypothetical protein